MGKYQVESTSILNVPQRGTPPLAAVTAIQSIDGIGAPVIRQIERNAEISPGKVAVIHKGDEVSYASLMTSAYRLAAGLANNGIASGSRVAVLMHPCLELVVSLLGIHLLGATYVPVDPNFPPVRLRMILEDVDPAAILCLDAGLLEMQHKVSDDFSTYLLDYESVTDIGIDKVSSFQAHAVKLSDESHIFFTSGTTGRPKGAVSSQLNLAHGMSSSAYCFELNSSHSFLSVAGSSFSISTFELISLLTLGGSVTIAERTDILEVERLFTVASQVSVWHFVPTLLARLIDFVEAEPQRIYVLKDLERILTGGDNVPPGLLCRIRKLLPWVRLYVNYGASETNCMVTYWPVIDSAPVKTKIGVAQKNVKLMVLDKDRQPVAAGEIGELFVSSPGVIPGYIHRADLNKQKFFEHGGSRYFATGDMARIDENGLYEMLGREDFQIQLNGNRIELLEVESTLKRMPGIKDCVVTAKNLNHDEASETLIAYLVLSGPETFSVSNVKSFLRGHLPGYMVPSLFLRLDTIPTNHNGKVDRINLPAPQVCQALQSNDEAPLRDALEQRVASIWGEVLATESIHANSQFFELGGNSISAVRLIAKLSAELNIGLSIADIVNNTTVREQASLIAEWRSKDSTLPPNSLGCDTGCLLLRAGRCDLPPLLLLNGVVEYLELAKALATERPVYAIYLPEEMDLIVHGAESSAATTTDSIGGITQLYLSVVTRLQPQGPYYLAGKSFGGIIAIEVGRQLEKLGHEVAFTGLLDTVTPEAFTAHRKLSFRVLQHIKHMFNEGPGYIVARFAQRYARLMRKNSLSNTSCSGQGTDSENIRIRHQVRKNAIFNTRLSRIHRPLVLIRARDRKHLYGEKPSQDLGWHKYCENLTIYEVPGDHHSILMAGMAKNVAQHLEAHI